MDKEFFVLGAFNDFTPSEENKMIYDENPKNILPKFI
jgi:hypothetical protein